MAKLCHGSPLLEGRSQERNKLSATFQHALSVTESLGHSFLWIDSLCIIQDSNHDLQLECSRMWEVYGNSYCTIAATASSDGSEGLFREHDAGGPVPCEIKSLWEDFTSNNPDERAAGYHFIHDFEFIESVDRSPLCRRAWVTQERLLSPKIMHFGHNQIWWECRELCASETYPQGIPTQVDGSMKQKWDPLSVSTTARPENCYNAWRWCVEHYSNCLLPHPEDKLIAFAGVARQIGQALQNCGESGTYFAGLRKDRLLSQLMWRYTYSEEHGKRSSTYKAPSWSWVSVDGHVFFLEAPKAKDLYFSKLVSHSILTAYDPFGAITAGQIRMCGPLIRVNLMWRVERGQDRGYGGISSYFHIISRTIPSSRFKCDIYLDDQASGNLNQTIEVHAFTISRSKSYGHLDGLLLQPTISQEKTVDHPRGSLVRVGTFRMEQNVSQRFLEIGTRLKDPDLAYEEANGMGCYTISIL